MSKTKDTHCSLYGWLREHNSELFAELEEMCAVGLFRPRHPVTFLNPNKKLTQELVKMSENGEGEKAFENLSSLFIFGKHSKLDGELISWNRKKIKTDLSGLKKDPSFVQWKSKDNSAVFSYDLPNFPAEGAAAKPPKLERKKRDIEGGNSEKRSNDTEKLFENLENGDNELFKKVARNLNSLLEHVKKNDEEIFDKIKLLLDPNMVVSWFILVQPTKTSGHHIPDEIYNKWNISEFPSVTGVETIHEIFHSIDNKNNDKLAEISELRKEMSKEGYKNTRDAVIKAYENNSKLLEDELRFRFSDDTTFQKSEINELSNLKWDEPERSLVLFADISSKNLENPMLHSIMIKFIDSNAFKYTLYNSKIHKRLKETISGAGHGNSNVKKMINILGNKNRNFITNMEKTDSNKVLSKFVSSLSSKQKSTLKDLLKNFD
jgi:hypothetical protein